MLFSAVTVALALAALVIFPMYFLRSFAYAGIGVVAVALAAALIPSLRHCWRCSGRGSTVSTSEDRCAGSAPP